MNNKGYAQKDSGKQVLILGGGIAGLSAAQAMDRWGVAVHLVERENHLGGHALEWACMATDQCQNCGSCLTAEIAEQAVHCQNAHFYLETEVRDVQRRDKGFQVHLKGKHSNVLTVDAVLIATGFEPFDPSQIESLRYSTQDKVITTAELNRLLKHEGLADFLSRNESPRIGFIQCIGSRNREQGRDYCSQVCCKVGLRQANKILYLLPNARISMFYMDLQIIGKEFRSQFHAIRDRLDLIQGVPGEILRDNDTGQLTVIQEDQKTGKPIAFHFDAIVLSVGMGPALGSSDLLRILGTKVNQWGFLGGEEVFLPEGVYVAGTAKGPGDIMNARRQGLIAAHDMARDLGLSGDLNERLSVAVLGDDEETAKAAERLVSDGYAVTWLNPGIHDINIPEGIGYFDQVQVEKVTGTVGQFTMRVNSNGTRHIIPVDTIVVATGAKRKPAFIPEPDDPNKRVMGLHDFEETFNTNPKSLPDRIAFWLDFLGNEWKDNARRSLLLASSLAEQNKDAYIMMENMLVHGAYGQRLYDLTRNKGVRFLRVSKRMSPPFTVDLENVRIIMEEATLGDTPITLLCDLLVIPEEVLPSEHNKRIGEYTKVDLDREGFLQPANIRHRLITSPRKGIFFLGSGHDEVDDEDLRGEIRELKSHLNLLKEEVLLTNSVVACINERACAHCFTCLRICPHGALMLRNSVQPYIVPEACFGCGMCVSACPVRAISMEREDASKEILPDQFDTKETVVFACERSAALAEKEALRLGLCSMENVRIIPVACAGGVGIETVLEPLLGNVQRVIVLGCHQGNCRSGWGGSFASGRIKRAATEIGLSEEKLEYNSVAANEPEKFARIVSE
jgi:heterodisulfide reductase subunit A-like polyferredoxin/coenzyme F420-reducing hydrogenase delta subunit